MENSNDKLSNMQALDKGGVVGGISHYIQFGVHLNERLGITSVTIDHNTTDLPNDSELIKRVAFTLLKAIQLNKGDIMLQDLLNEIGISRDSTKELLECTVCWGGGKIEIDDFGNEKDCTWCNGTGLVTKNL